MQIIPVQYVFLDLSNTCTCFKVADPHSEIEADRKEAVLNTETTHTGHHISEQVTAVCDRTLQEEELVMETQGKTFILFSYIKVLNTTSYISICKG